MPVKATITSGVAVTALAFGVGTPLHAAAPDACKLLRPGEVGAMLGIRDVRATPGGTACTYHGAGKPDVLTVEVHRNDSAGWTGISGGNVMIGANKHAPKIGDESFYGAMGQVLYVRKGTSWIAVDMRGVMTSPASAGPALARKATARL